VAHEELTCGNGGHREFALARTGWFLEILAYYLLEKKAKNEKLAPEGGGHQRPMEILIHWNHQREIKATESHPGSDVSVNAETAELHKYVHEPN
jgi:hypothetical protein